MAIPDPVLAGGLDRAPWFAEARADLGRDRLAGDSIVQWIGAVHDGAFGSWPIKLLWMLGGILFPVIATTGVIVWVNKRR